MRLSVCQSPLVLSLGLIWAAVTAQPLAAQNTSLPQLYQTGPARECLGTKPFPVGVPIESPPIGVPIEPSPMTGLSGSVEAVPRPLPPTAIYRGELVDTTDPKRHIHAILSFALCNLHYAGDGFFQINPPFASNGVFYLQATRDSVRITTTSDSGGRIVWSAKRKGYDLDGTYTVVRGQSPTQRGWWYVGLATGQAIPETVHGWP